MVSTNGNGGLSAADVAAVMGSNGYGNGWGLGGDGAWWLIILILMAGMAGVGLMDGMGLYPWMNQADITTSGFQNQATNTAINSLQNSVTSGFGDVQTALCSGFAGVNASVNGAQNAISQQLNTNQLAALERSFAEQTANTNNFFNLQSQLAQCCCDNRLATANLTSTILSENCADRAAVSDGVRDLLVNQTANTQRLVDTTTSAVQGVMDKICQLELDAKNNKIADLQNQLTMANLAASQTAQTARILADNAAQTTALEQYLNPVAIPAYQVPNPNCCNNFNGCCNG